MIGFIKSRSPGKLIKLDDGGQLFLNEMNFSPDKQDPLLLMSKLN